MLTIVQPPAGPVVTLAEARDHLAIDPDDASQDAAIQREIAAITAWLAGPQGWLGRSLVEQTLVLDVDPDAVWRRDELVLPRPPLIAVDDVSGIDVAGAAHPIPATTYRIAGGRDGLSRLLWRPGTVLPLGLDELASLRVRYRAGYGTSSAAVDQGIRQAVLMTLARVHEFRGDGVASSLQTDPELRQFFAPYRVWAAS